MSGDQHRRVAVAGASGTIGRAVLRELLARGHEVTAFIRSGNVGIAELSGAQIFNADLTNNEVIQAELAVRKIETVISCIASRSGSPKDAAAVDYGLNHQFLNAAQGAGLAHFILLSAICVQRPLLAFQKAKLRFEAELRAAPIEHTIIHPTAFFKSLSGQVGRVLDGKPFFLFGDGELTSCKPISDRDLARLIVNCVSDPSTQGKTLPIGGPGPAISLKQQGELLFEAAGIEPRFRSLPPGMFKLLSGALSVGASVSDWCAEKAEYARIAHYYATQSMLVLDQETGEYSAEATPEFGEDHLIDHYRKLVAERRAEAGAI